MSSPLIGLTTYNDKNKDGYPVTALMRMYISALAEAGGVPVLIPSGLTDEALQTLFSRLDGILLPGGGDVAIERYNGVFHPRVGGVDPERDETEIALLRNTVNSGKPFLGICRGCQVVNVALGGTLFTHIQDQLPGAIKHDYDSYSQRKFLAHTVDVEHGSCLANITDEIRLTVNSLHHQGVKEIAPGLHAVAYAPDGLVEAVELTGHPFGMAVQWHPEWLTDQPSMQRLFQALVTAAGRG